MNNQAHMKRTMIGLMAVALSAVLSVSASFGATILGQVRAHDGGAGIEQAVVELDKLPADGVAESSAVTDLFGFFRFDDVPTGRYQMTTTHSDYATDTQTNSLEATEVLNIVVELKSAAEDTAAVRGEAATAEIACTDDGEKDAAGPTHAIRAPRRSTRYRRKAPNGTPLRTLSA